MSWRTAVSTAGSPFAMGSATLAFATLFPCLATRATGVVALDRRTDEVAATVVLVIRPFDCFTCVVRIVAAISQYVASLARQQANLLALFYLKV